MEAAINSVSAPSLSVEMDEEAVTINNKRFDLPPTVQQLTNLLSAQPRRINAPPPLNSDKSYWLWDDCGIGAIGVDQNDLSTIAVFLRSNTKQDLPSSSFQGSFKLFGVDALQPDAMDNLNQDFFRLPEVGMLVSCKTKPGGKVRVGAPEIHFTKGECVAFGYPSRQAGFPFKKGPKTDERVLADFDSSTVNFGATLTNHRLIITIPGKPLLQWSLKDVRSVKIRTDVGEGETIGAVKAWKGNPAVVAFLDKRYKPPFHIMDVDSSSNGKTSIVTARYIQDGNELDGCFWTLENFVDCVSTALNRYRRTAPPLDPATDEIIEPTKHSVTSPTTSPQSPVPTIMPRHIKTTGQLTSKPIKFFMLLFGAGIPLSILGAFALSGDAQMFSIYSIAICLVGFFLTKGPIR